MANTVEHMGITVSLDVDGADDLQKALDKIAEKSLKSGDSASQAALKVKAFFDEYQRGLQRLGKTEISSSKEARMIETAVKGVSKLLNIGGGSYGTNLDKAHNPNFQRNAVFGAFTTSNFGRALIAVKSLNLAFSEAHGIWRFAEGIEKVNQRLLLMHYTSGIGVSSLKDLGAAAKAFGGSAEGIASAEERRQRQLAKARRGEGFGYLQEANWKYGFNINLGADATQTRNEAIMHARSSLAPEEFLSFFELIDPANAKWMSAVAKMDDKMFSKWQALQSRMEGYGQLGTTGGGNRVEEVSRATQEYEMATAELARSWEAVRDELAVALLPVMTQLVNVARGFTDWLNKNPGLLDTIAYLGGAITGLAAVIKGAQWIKFLASLGGAGGGGAGAAAGASAAGTAFGTSAFAVFSKGAAQIGAMIAVGIAGWKVGKQIGKAISDWMEKRDKEEEDSNNSLQNADIQMMQKRKEMDQKAWIGGYTSEDTVIRSFAAKDDIDKILSNFDEFKKHWEKARARVAKQMGISEDQLGEYSIDHLQNIHSSLVANRNSIDNRRKEMHVTFNGWRESDPGAVVNAISPWWDKLEDAAESVGIVINADSEI